jgi:hypothetical protein
MHHDFFEPTTAMDYYLLMIPSHGDMALALDTESILCSMSYEVWGQHVSNPELLDDILPDMIDRIIEDGLINIYPLKKGSAAPPACNHEWIMTYELIGSETITREYQCSKCDATDSEHYANTCSHEWRFKEERFNGTEMDQIWECIHCRLEYFNPQYDLNNGDPVTPQQPVTEPTEPPLPEPYPEMAEYIQYGISDDVGINHSDFARSNRVCQFVTDRGNYRLRSLIPEVFVFTEDYHYDVKEDTSHSRISIRHHEEGWRMEAWVFNDPVESIYQGFPMTAEDGSQLWFYVSSYPESYDDNQLQALMGRIPELVTLSTAKDDDWGKVRIGETLISHNNQYWNGLAYTAGSFDYWAFEKILDSHALSGYDLRHAGQRVVNGITWDFYTTGSPSGYPDSNGKDYYFTNVYVVCSQEDIWLQTSLSYGLSPSNSQFVSQAEYEADLDWEMGFAIDTIVRTGLSNYYLYP